MFSFAMTSGLASDSDKFKIIITLRRAQKFGDMRTLQNFDFFVNPFSIQFFLKFRPNDGMFMMTSIFGDTVKGVERKCSHTKIQI